MRVVPLVPQWAKPPLRAGRDWFQSIIYAGSGRWCPVCQGSCRRFAPAGIRRLGARCPHCGSLERHRAVWLYWDKMTDLFDDRPKKMLHVAPERCLAPRLRRRLGSGYVTADLMDSKVMVRMDVTDIQYPDDTFDVIFCSHVLEHVPDDRRAMREFRRVLKPDGWAILLVPVGKERTRENSSIVDPRERLRAFGQEDHVRRYGPDYVDRLREAGFRVTISRISELLAEDEVTRMGLGSQEIYHCEKT